MAERYRVREEIRLEGHIIDSWVLPRVFDTIMDLGGDFEVLQVEVGRTKDDPSTARLSVGAATQESLTEILDSPELLSLEREIDSGVARCRRECSYFRLCGGGAPANKIYENRTAASTETMFCRMTKQAVIDVVLDRIIPVLEANG